MDKICTRCLKTKTLDEFHRSRHGKNGRTSVCKKCWRLTYAPLLYKGDPYAVAGMKTCTKCEETKPRKAFGPRKPMPDGLDARCRECVRFRKLKRVHGLSRAGFERLCPEQCAICMVPLSFDGPKGLRPHVDHCHRTKKVRGILCGPCNTNLARFDDNPALLRKAASYLENAS